MRLIVRPHSTGSPAHSPSGTSLAGRRASHHPGNDGLWPIVRPALPLRRKDWTAGSTAENNIGLISRNIG